MFPRYGVLLLVLLLEAAPSFELMELRVLCRPYADARGCLGVIVRTQTDTEPQCLHPMPHHSLLSTVIFGVLLGLYRGSIKGCIGVTAGFSHEFPVEPRL